MDDETNVISLAGAKPAPTGEIDVFLAKRGLNRAWVEATFAKYVPNEKDVPEVARAQWMLDSHRELRAMIEAQAAQAQAELAEILREERQMEEALVCEKTAYLAKLQRFPVRSNHLTAVMPALVAGIHVFLAVAWQTRRRWRGTSPAMTRGR